jgi:hypothetical protein
LLALYLPTATVEALAAETCRNSNVNINVSHWISDITTSAFSKVLSAGAVRCSPFATCRRPTVCKANRFSKPYNATVGRRTHCEATSPMSDSYKNASAA